jgi:glycosyltransferase involved in cell wall biosynthesis
MISPNPIDAAASGSRSMRVCLVLEGTYPYVSGGVSTWVHQIIRALPQIEFAIHYIGDKKRPQASYRYEIPDNVVEITETYLFDPLPASQTKPGRGSRQTKTTFVNHIAAFLDAGDDGARLEALDHCVQILRDKPSAFTLADIVHSSSLWNRLTEACAKNSPDVSFLRYHAAARDLASVLWRLLTGAITLPPADVYHCVCTGYAGFLGAVAARNHNVSLLLSEHGIYLKERIEDIRKSTWLEESNFPPAPFEGSFGPLRELWIDFFALLSRLAYREATCVTALFQENARLQASFGAVRDKITIIPNGIELDEFNAIADRNLARAQAASSLPVIGFLGRIAPIKDVKTLLRAARLVLNRYPHARFLIAGPHDEDPAYHEECLALARQLEIGDAVVFPGPMNRFDFLDQVGVVVLTSISEGLPFAILEAAGAGLPTVATDVGACKELLVHSLSGSPEFGPAGIVTPVASPPHTAHAIIQLIEQPNLRHAMGIAGRDRVEHSYRQREIIARYENLYHRLPEVKSAPFSSAALPGTALTL